MIIVVLIILILFVVPLAIWGIYACFTAIACSSYIFSTMMQAIYDKLPIALQGKASKEKRRETFLVFGFCVAFAACGIVIALISTIC